MALEQDRARDERLSTWEMMPLRWQDADLVLPSAKERNSAAGAKRRR